MYCVKCGVELADSQRKCPLCDTPVYFPGLVDDPERPYPPRISKEKVNPRGVLFIFSFIFFIGAIISVITDFSINGVITWAGYAVGGIVTAYVIFLLPSWFSHRHPAVFTPVDFGVMALFLAYINLATGGSWFLSFALPVTGVLGLIVCSVVILSHYLRCGYLYIAGGAIIALGGFSILIEWLSVVTFRHAPMFLWSLYPAVTLVLIGIMLLVIAIVRPFRESLRRIFAL